MTQRQVSTCPIWGESYPAVVANRDPASISVLYSPRSGGPYDISLVAKEMIEKLDDGAKAQITTCLVDARRQGEDPPFVSTELVEAALVKQRITVSDRADRLLRYLVSHSAVAGETVELGLRVKVDEFAGSATPLSEGPSLWNAMAQSESTQPDEVGFLNQFLMNMGWIRGRRQGGVGMGLFTVSVDGYRHVEDLEKNPESPRAFVAMWFNPETELAYDQGIKLAIEDAGYEPVRIDRKDHANKIDDEIIMEIKRSRFIVADFTQGEDGSRGGVYYEAGFGLGLGLRVIYTCRRSQVDKLAFDTRQFSHILWDTPEELRQLLRHRIARVVGDGPFVRY